MQKDSSLLDENNLTAERKEVSYNSDNHTADELEVAKLLTSSLTDNFIAPSSGEGNNLVIFPWAGTNNTTRSISLRIGQFLSERSRTQLVHVISTLVLSERRQILSTEFLMSATNVIMTVF